MSDRELLERFKATGSEAAFRRLVERYAGLVFAVAVRRTGNRSVAEEVTQSVFVILAAKAPRLKTQGQLAGWLHRTSLLEASNAARREQTRQKKMEEYIDVNATVESPAWPQIAPVLDEAIDQLKDADRSAVLLRFYDGLSFREVSVALGKTEAATRKQVARALSKLSGILRRKGITTTSAVLSAGMASHLSAAGLVPAAATLSQGALAGAATVSKSSIFIHSINTMAYAKTKTAVVVAALAAIPLGIQWNENRKLRESLSENGLSVAESGERSRGVLGNARSAGRSGGGADKRGKFALSSGGARGGSVGDWRRALYEQDPVQRSQRIAELIAGLNAGNAESIAGLFFGESAEAGFGTEARLFLRAWAQLDGERAIQFLENQGQAGSANPAMLAALGGWASRNPMAARSWAEGLEDEGLRENMLFGVIDGWALADFQAAADYAETRPRSDARTRFIDLLMKRSMANGDLAGAQNWFSGISNDDHNKVYKRRAFERIVATMLYRDPSAAAHWISSQAGESFISPNAVSSTARKLAQDSPEDALRWLSSMSKLDEQLSAGSHADVLKNWARKNPEASGEWLGNNMDHPGFDRMAGEYSAAVANVDSLAALEWARSIQDDAQREAALVRVGRQRLHGGGGTEEELRLAGFTDQQIAQAKEQTHVRWLEATTEYASDYYDLSSVAYFPQGTDVVVGEIDSDFVFRRRYEAAVEGAKEQIQGLSMSLDTAKATQDQVIEKLNLASEDLDISGVRLQSTRILINPSQSLDKDE